MHYEPCEGCVRARDEDGIAVPGAPACLGCRRALPANRPCPDLWLARPPGGSPVTCDGSGVSFDEPLPEGVRYGVPAAMLLVGLTCAGSGAAAVLVLAGVLLWSGLVGRAARLRHSWEMRGDRVRHTVRVAGLRVSRTYPLWAVRAFHCAGPRLQGPVGFHNAAHTVTVGTLPAPADNEWLMRRLNERLSAAGPARRR